MKIVNKGVEAVNKALEILNEQFLSCNKKFTQFIDSEYSHWLSSSERPTLSVDIFKYRIRCFYIGKLH